jgi:hypothetical protein
MMDYKAKHILQSIIDIDALQSSRSDTINITIKHHRKRMCIDSQRRSSLSRGSSRRDFTPHRKTLHRTPICEAGGQGGL